MKKSMNREGKKKLVAPKEHQKQVGGGGEKKNCQKKDFHERGVRR